MHVLRVGADLKLLVACRLLGAIARRRLDTALHADAAALLV
jgi:hypothetical protein